MGVLSFKMCITVKVKRRESRVEINDSEHGHSLLNELKYSLILSAEGIIFALNSQSTVGHQGKKFKIRKKLKIRKTFRGQHLENKIQSGCQN